MKLKNYNIYFFFALLLGVTALAYLILKPFLIIFLIGVIFAQIFYPLYRFFLRFIKMEGLSSAAVCIIALLIVVLPLIFVLSLVVGEIQGMINLFVKNPDSVRSFLDSISNSLSRFSLPGYIDFKSIISQDSLVSALKNSTQAILFILQSAYSSVAYFLFATLIMFFSFFYLLIDGKKLLAKVMDLSPLENKYEGMIVARFNSITRATIRGSIFIAIGQGILGGILFFFAGVSSPVFFGMLMMITSVIPPVGSGLIWFPVGVAMLLLGHIGEGVAIILFGMLVISTIDNFIRPKLVGRDTELHPLLIIFSTLGGIAIFGITGFIIGPVIMSLFVSLWDIYALEFKTQLREFNK